MTSRWDDNTWTNLKTRAVLLEHGHRGTFFLNDPSRNVYGKDYGLLADRSVSQWGRVLASGGTTIGGHSLTHPMLSYQNRNRMFEEVLGCRIALEAAFDTLVNAYAFSFCNYRSPIEGVDVQRDIATVTWSCRVPSNCQSPLCRRRMLALGCRRPFASGRAAHRPSLCRIPRR